MEREHLFRAYDRRTKKFIAKGFDVVGETTMFNMIEQYVSEHKDPNETTLERLGDVVVDLCSTLYDKSGTKVFEGDIFPVNLTPKKGVIDIYGVVVFHNGMFCIRYKHPEISDPYTYVPLYEFLAAGNKIIAGNIHDNEELLQNI